MRSATLPHAYREIERLRQRVQELETELESERKAEKPVQQLNTPPSLPPSTPDNRDTGSNDFDHGGGRRKRFCEGIHVRTARSPLETWYGSSSIFYFIDRINSFLTSALQQHHSAQRLLPNSASKLLDGPTTRPLETDGGQLVTPTDDLINTGDYLSPTQEEYFLGLFWQSYYTSCPILDELEFKEHYQSLWAESDKERKPSALVDIVLAVCMQYGMARLPTDGSGPNATSRAHVSQNDATIAGRWHYQRCQMLLSGELESPSLSTLQCHILSSIYLYCGSFLNMADSACALAVRTAFMLGLHLEPSETMARREREMRKRCWWSLYVLESKMSMNLGRPFLLHEFNTTCTLPADDREISMLSGSSLVPMGRNVSWLTWNLHNTKLMRAARTAYIAFHDSAPNNMCSDQPITDRMEEWLKGVPDALKTKRQNNGVPFSTDQSPLEIEQFAPLWLQHQRLLLELLYHNLCTDLYRPAIFLPASASPSLQADTTATRCAAHAMALTHIMHQVLSSTTILAGWYEAFQWQWNSAVTLVGFVLAYPQSASTPAARSAIDLSVAVLDFFGTSFASAASAAHIVRELSGKVDRIAELSRSKRPEVPMENVSNGPEDLQLVMSRDDSEVESLVTGTFTAPQSTDGSMSFDDESAAEITGVLAQSIDIFAMEQCKDFDWLGINSNFSDRDFNKQISYLS